MPETNETPATEPSNKTRVYLASRKTPIVVDGDLDAVRSIVENAPDGTFVTFTSAGRRFSGAVSIRASEVVGLREEEPALIVVLEEGGRYPFRGTLESAIEAYGAYGTYFRVEDEAGNVLHEPQAPEVAEEDAPEAV